MVGCVGGGQGGGRQVDTDLLSTWSLGALELAGEWKKVSVRHILGKIGPLAATSSMFRLLDRSYDIRH